MLEVRYEKLVPYPYDTVLAQYYDYEHIAHVHPESLGEYRLVSVDGDVAVYEQIWPRRWGRRKRSLVEQRFEPPDLIRFTFQEGLHRGVVVETRLRAVDGGTVVDELYRIPGVPNWSWIRALAKPSIVKRVDHIWDEDLEVEVCHGGWPGLPESLRSGPDGAIESEGESELSWVAVCSATEVAVDGLRAYSVGAWEVALGRIDGRLVAVSNLCPHAGGPLAIGAVENSSVSCPWHGARFDLSSGRCTAGPGEEGVATFEIRERDGQIEIAKPSVR